MNPIPVVSDIATTIQISIAPVFLLAGIGAMLNVMVGRLARIVDRARVLEQLHPTSSGHEHDRHVDELRLMNRRISVINWAIFLITAAAVAVSMVVALLFIARLSDFHIGVAIAGAFILSMGLLITGLILFLIEVRMSVRAIRVRDELLER